jgi:Flp pilus assembly protein TadB
MSGAATLLALCGLGLGFGTVLLVASTRRRGPDGRRWFARRAHARPRRDPRLLATAGAAGVLAVLITDWIVAAPLAAMLVLALPRLLGGTKDQERQAGRIDALAGWTEALRDTLAAAAGLEQAILATARTVAPPIRPQITALAARLGNGERLVPCLRILAEELADPTADLVINALIAASEHQARQLAALLGRLAHIARARVEMRQRVETSRARTKTTMRVITVTFAVFAGGLILLNRPFLRPYDSPSGQLVLLVIGGVFVGAFTWLRAMARMPEPERFLAPDRTVDPAPATTDQGVRA